MFEERSFVASEASLPKPEIHFDSSERLLVVATPWGPRGSAKRAIQTTVDYFLSSKSDAEVTSPFRRLTNLSGPANNLRIGVMLANEAIYREENKSEYHSGLEIFAASFSQNEVVLVQSGHPNILLSRRNRSLLLPLSTQLDLADEFGKGSTQLPSLPTHLLGVDVHPNLFVSSFRPQPGDKLVLVSRSWLPEELLFLPNENRNLEHISKILAKETHTPFWLGIWDLF